MGKKSEESMDAAGEKAAASEAEVQTPADKPEDEDTGVEAAQETTQEEPVDIETLRVQARERDEFLDLLRRTRAELSNYRKRVERERTRWTELAVGDFVLKLIPVLEDFDRALARASETTDLEAFVQGVRLIENKIYDVLRMNDIEPFEPRLGEPFDPARHEAVIVEQTDSMPDNTVSDVVLKGYVLGERVLRPARVKVAKRVTPQAGGSAPEEHHGKDETGDADV